MLRLESNLSKALLPAKLHGVKHRNQRIYFGIVNIGLVGVWNRCLKPTGLASIILNMTIVFETDLIFKKARTTWCGIEAHQKYQVRNSEHLPSDHG